MKGHSMKENPMDLMDLMEHERARAQAARQGWIAWRMADLPAVYQNLMPVTYDAVELWEAEEAIRRQVAADLKLLQSPWCRIGPECSLIDWGDMDSDTRIKIGLRSSIPVGFRDRPKDECLHHPEVEAAREQARQTPEYQAAMAKVNAWNELQDAERAMSDALEAEADEATLAPVRERLHTLRQQWNDTYGGNDEAPFIA
jgi:hypothetical protein